MSTTRFRRGPRALAAAIAMTVTLPVSAAVALPGLPAAAPAALATTAGTDGPTTPSAMFEEVAFAEAARTGKPVEILDRRQEATEFFANPSGSTTRRSYGEPKWTRYDGMWRRTDAKLVRHSDGSVGPAAATYEITFSGGGDQPMATMVKEGKKLALAWPTPLPAPVLDDNTATYRSVLPGVDLKLVADVSGFAQHLVVHTPEAAANPALRSIELGLTTEGVTLTEAADNRLLAKDGNGETVFSAPGPKMWEQPVVPADGQGAGPAAKSAARSAPATPARQPDSAPVSVAIGDGTLTLAPDAGLLASADQFPLVIDPVFGDGHREKWAVVYSATPDAAYPNGSGWNSSNPADEPRVGFNDTGDTASFFAMNTDGLEGATINRATFAVIQTHSYVCSDSTVGPTELWSAGSIATTPTWRTQNWGSKLASGNFSGGNDTFCPGNIGHDFTGEAVKSFVQQAADGGWGTTVFGLRAPTGYSGNHNAYKRFKNNPVLEVDFNKKPLVNSKGAYEGYYVESGDGNTPVACGGRIGRSGISLTANIKDPDGGAVTAYFTVKNSSGATVSFGSKASSGTVSGSGEVEVLMEGKNLANGTYTWSVYAKDGENTTSAVTASCSFSVDMIGPDQPVTVLDGDGTKAGEAKDSYKARVPRQFKFTNPVSDIAGYCWAMDRTLSSVTTPRCPNGTWVDAGSDAKHTATVTITPFAHPVSKINVVAYDKFGNRSTLAGGDDQISLTTTTPEFVYEKENSDPIDNLPDHDRPGDLNGDGFADFVATDPDGKLWFYGGNGNLGTPAARQNVGSAGWSGALIAHRGDLKGMSSRDSAPDGYEDFLVRLPDNRLYLYPGNGVGSPWVYTRKELIHPSRGSDWSNLRQMLLPGNIDGKPGDDLITVECVYDGSKECVNGRLVLYSGFAIGGGGQDHTKLFDWGTPVTLGTGGWLNLTNLAVSDVNGDAYADLVARDPADGKLYLYPGCVNDAVLCPGSAYKLLPRSVYGTGGWNQRPYLTSPGNTQGALQDDIVTKNPDPDSLPGTQPVPYPFKRFIPTTGQEAGDIWATTTADATTPVGYVDADGNSASRLCPSGCLLIYPGGRTQHGAPRLVGTAGWATAITGIF
ncbi:FG-GAP repeat domain-containing protein [Streptomyces sp. NPDC059247]|uniref:FG-GAP repeat domain-containing protein n=1 Tax=Streptomyces sp. NPDC059247 TaxID=3346790 RepID=UPI00367E3A7A